MILIPVDSFSLNQGRVTASPCVECVVCRWHSKIKKPLGPEARVTQAGWLLKAEAKLGLVPSAFCMGTGEEPK